MIKILVGFLLGFFICLILCPISIKIIRRLQVRQTILKYVSAHKDKQGTPTMGGISFLLTISMAAFMVLKVDTFWVLGLAVGMSFGLLGFLDDLIKVKYHQNLGLRPYQKIIGQLGISMILACYIYFFSGNGGVIILPFTYKVIDIGFWIIPLVIFVCIALTNSVNLTDGLDGLAGSVGAAFFMFLGVLLLMYKDVMFNAGAPETIINNLDSMVVICSIVLGSMLAYLIFNTYKANVFMGDVGSLGLGGLASAVCCLTGFELFIPIVGVVFVITTASVIIQVLHYKKTKKRVFLMSPIHHHFQLKGHAESKIVAVYTTTTAVLSILTILITLLVR